MYFSNNSDTIIALATPSGKGAIAVVRLSGKKAVEVVNYFFKSKDLAKVASHTIHWGLLRNNGKLIDEILVSVFIAPRSYTGENMVEISCHGSAYIVESIIRLFVAHGVRYAKAGEFTQRAFLNGKLDLTQAEAVADLIASDSEITHQTALKQMRGGFSKEIKTLREKLIHFASLIELELDFAEEDVEFADRSSLRQLIKELQQLVSRLVESFALGNVIKNGVATVIVGKPNTGKSTLLNTLLNEEKAIVSDIAGTTRDVIEDEMVICGITFRFIDTAGLRDTTDEIEAIGVQKTYEQMKQAALIIYLFDISTETLSTVQEKIDELKVFNTPLLCVANKIDLVDTNTTDDFKTKNMVAISATKQMHIATLKQKLISTVYSESFESTNTIVTNARHHESLSQTQKSLYDVLAGINKQVSTDLLALDMRTALRHLGEIMGEITTEDLLDNIFSKFCIGK